VRDKNGSVLNSQEERKNRWIEHLQEVLNRPHPSYPLEIDEAHAAVEIDIGPIQ
jgi:hypothetical protein